jgi:outer membrane protein assembly factor BamB
MSIEETSEKTPVKPLRLWPGVVIVAVQWLLRFGIPLVAPDGQLFGFETQLVSIFAGPAGLLAIGLWWLFFSRALWSERLGAIILMVLAIVATRPLTHQSIRNGFQGMLFVLFAVPATLSLALVIWAAASRRLSPAPRRAALVAAMLLGSGVWLLARTNGVYRGGADLEWRWTPTAEERLLTQANDETKTLPPPSPVSTAPGATAATTPKAETTSQPPVPKTGETPAVPLATPSAGAPKPTAPPAVETEAAAPTTNETRFARLEWPGFRGPDRDSIVRGVLVKTDWAASPPVELWRRPIGPGWSSFAVAGDHLYTQEQRGEEEIVACYNLTTGKPIWMHRDTTRFWESNGGAGPRATPTLNHGRVYTFGATGILNALDATSGDVVWTRNVSSDTRVKVPGWGFAGSPLVVGDVVIVAASGALAGYDAGSGNRRWFVKSRGGSYSSPHLVTIDGVEQVLLMGGSGVTSVTPADGKVLWDNTWSGAPMVQPAVISGGDLVVTTADAMGGLGIRRLNVAHDSGGWKVEERWTSRALKPYFNDFAVHKGHAFGFDGAILACIDLEDGQRKWKGGRYGNGQLMLLADQDLLLVLSEEGELALVNATPDQFTEVARFPVLEGKTWNHPVLVGDILLVRNGEQMAAFRLSPPSN